MFFENNYIYFSNKLIINSIPKYKTIMIKFINVFIKLKKSSIIRKMISINHLTFLPSNKNYFL